MLTADQVVSRDPRTASRVIAGEAIILTPADSQIRNLNETGSRIWELLEGKPTVGELVARICSEFEVSEDRAGPEVLAFLDQLVSRGLVVAGDGGKAWG